MTMLDGVEYEILPMKNSTNFYKILHLRFVWLCNYMYNANQKYNVQRPCNYNVNKKYMQL